MKIKHLAVLAILTFISTFAGSQATARFAGAPYVENCLFPAPNSVGGANFGAVWAGGVLKCAVLEFQWGSIDNSAGPNFNPASQIYTTMDTLIGNYVSTYPGIQIEVLLSPSQDISPNSSSGTPQYVQTNANQHMCFCPGYAGTGWGGGNGCFLGNTIGTNYTGVVDPLDAPFQAAWFGTPTTPGFLPTTIAHMKTKAYWTSVISIAAGFDRGGENYPSCDPYEKQALSNASDQALTTVWAAGNGLQAASMAAALQGSSVLGFIGIACVGNSSYPASANKCFHADAEAAAIAAASIAGCAGCIGIRLTIYRDSDRYNWLDNAPCESDWCFNFTRFAIPVDVQEGNESNPAGAAGCPLSNTGPWTNALPFISQHWGQGIFRIHEGLQNDWYGAYASGYTDSGIGGVPCWPAGFVTGNGGFPYPPYDTALKFLAAGLPLATNSVGGR